MLILYNIAKLRPLHYIFTLTSLNEGVVWGADPTPGTTTLSHTTEVGDGGATCCNPRYQENDRWLTRDLVGPDGGATGRCDPIYQDRDLVGSCPITTLSRGYRLRLMSRKREVSTICAIVGFTKRFRGLIEQFSYT